MHKINTFHVGPQKSGTTWLYTALVEHPEVCSSPRDSIHYFNIFYHKPIEWYYSHFQDVSKKVLFDPTPSYLRDQQVPKRIYEYNPNAKIMFTARNPIERAFSHYWHEKKKDRFNFTFEEIFDNYDLFTNWVEPGMYSMHYKRYLSFFPREHIKILFFDDLINDPKEFFKGVCEFCGINSSFVPSVIEKRINTAENFRSYRQRQMDRHLLKAPFGNRFVRLKNKYFTKGYKEKLKDVDNEFKNKLIDVFNDDILNLEKLTGRRLSHWTEKY